MVRIIDLMMINLLLLSLSLDLQKKMRRLEVFILIARSIACPIQDS